MNRVAVLNSHLTTGDAVSNDVLGMCRALNGRGVEARIFAESCDFTEPKVFPPGEIQDFLTDSSDLLIYHYSISWEPGPDILRKTRARIAVKYHNITPPEFFAGVSPWHEEKCRLGREELKEIARADCDLYLADSEFNRRDLLLEGVSEGRCFVVPPFHHIDRLNSIEPDIQVLDRYRDGRANVLMVGRVAPNKSHPALIEAFAAYHHDYNQDSRLLIVGKEESRLAAYNRLLRGLVGHFELDGSVVFAGEVTDQQLKAYYAVADVFMITSEHEGFCVPLVEAMSMKLPIVAYGSSAIPDTVGGAGLVWEERDPYLMAESVNVVIKGNGVASSLGEKGLRRYEQNFTNEVIRKGFLEAVGRFL